MTSHDDLKQVPLDARHRALGAKMVPFAGFEMPLQYTGIKDEHEAVRSNVGLFDVSHMGEVEFTGPDALAAVDHLVTNDVSKLEDGKAMYSAMCDEAGGIVDDLVLYRLASDHVLVVVNAANRAKDVAHILEHTPDRFDVTIEDRSDAWVQLALQGPKAEALLQPLTEAKLADIGYYTGRTIEVGGVECFVSRTGYTGEDGFEIYGPAEKAEALFDAIWAAGEAFDLKMCGLGCRDTLRLEAKYNLYGQDMTEETNPLEAGLGWVVKLKKDADFVGKKALERIKQEGVTRRLRGVVLEGRGVLRPGYPLFVGDEQVGALTSGTYSPTLDESIGMGYVAIAHADRDAVEVEIRGRRLPARLTKKAFYTRG